MANDTICIGDSVRLRPQRCDMAMEVHRGMIGVAIEVADKPPLTEMKVYGQSGPGRFFLVARGEPDRQYTYVKVLWPGTRNKTQLFSSGSSYAISPLGHVLMARKDLEDLPWESDIPTTTVCYEWELEKVGEKTEPPQK